MDECFHNGATYTEVNDTEEDAGKFECKEMPLTEAGEIDNPLVSKYCELNNPPDLEIAKLHAVGLLII